MNIFQRYISKYGNALSDAEKQMALIKKQTSQPTVILLGGAASAGKTYIAGVMNAVFKAHHLKSQKFSFATLLKHLAAEIYNWDGKKDEYGRKLLQDIGMKFRNFDTTYWAKRLVEFIQITNPDLDFIVIDDFRFENELETFTAASFKTYTIKISNDEAEAALSGTDHPSEQLWKDDEIFDTIIYNHHDDTLSNPISRERVKSALIQLHIISL